MHRKPEAGRHSASSSTDEPSSADDSDHEHGYQTDPTTAPSSEMSAEVMQAEDVEEFREREYPMLKGKTYLDHGGTTVSFIWLRVVEKYNKY